MGEGLALFGGHQGFGGVLFQQLLVGSEIPKKGAQRGGFPLAGGRHVVPVVRHVVHKGIDFIGGHRADKLQVRVLHGDFLKRRFRRHQAAVPFDKPKKRAQVFTIFRYGFRRQAPHIAQIHGVLLHQRRKLVANGKRHFFLP